MAVIHISESEAASNFSAVMDRVRAGEDVRIDSGAESFVIQLARAIPRQPRLIADVLADLERHGSMATLPTGFGDAMEAGIRSHEHETLTDSWE